MSPPYCSLRSVLLLLIAAVLGYILVVSMFNCQQKWFRPLGTDRNKKKPNSSDEDQIGKMLANSVDCQRVFGGDLAYAMANKLVIRENDPGKHMDLPMDCASVRRRSGLEGREWRGSQEERDFPLAFARVVYKDYFMLERELATHYAPHNWYCFAIDSKSRPSFRSRMRQLAECFPNVLIARRELAISSQGHNTSDAMLECARELALPSRQWRYLLTLQNHDIQAKSNGELVRIFKWLDGVNDMEIGRQHESIKLRISYYRSKFNWSFSALKLFKNESRNMQAGTASSSSPLLHLSKGYSSASLSREFVDFVLNELNLDKLLEQLNQAEFGVDEHLWQSLGTTDQLHAPGTFPQFCYDQGIETPFITRFALWGEEVTSGKSKLKCRSGMWRHGVCVFGLEDLVDSSLLHTHFLFVNKMMPEYDFAAIKCWHERMAQRQLGLVDGQINPEFYTDWPQTKYNWLRRKQANLVALPENINCQL